MGSCSTARSGDSGHIKQTGAPSQALKSWVPFSSDTKFCVSSSSTPTSPRGILPSKAPGDLQRSSYARPKACGLGFGWAPGSLRGELVGTATGPAIEVPGEKGAASTLGGAPAPPSPDGPAPPAHGWVPSPVIRREAEGSPLELRPACWSLPTWNPWGGRSSLSFPSPVAQRSSPHRQCDLSPNGGAHPGGISADS